jgi:hypothetical protein
MALNLAGLTAQSYIGTLSPQPIQAAGQGGFAVPVEIDFTAYGGSAVNSAILVNLSVQAGSGTRTSLLDRIRSVYVDNTFSALPIYVQFPDTLFTITVQPYSVGWYPVFTNGFVVNIAIFGLTNFNVPVSNLYISNLKVAPFTDSALPSTLNQELASPALGGGSSLLTIFPVIEGQGYNSDAMTVVGGGGVNAAAHGVLDSWGRFTGVVIDNPGTGFIGPPQTTASGGQRVTPNFVAGGTYNVSAYVTYSGTEWQYTGSETIITGSAAWSSATTYSIGNEVNYNGNIYYCIKNNRFNTPPPVNTPSWVLLGTVTPVAGQGWSNSGTPAGTTAVFDTLLNSATGAQITTSGIGPAALGDQLFGNFYIVTGTGVIQDGLWGTPYNSGFIYVTHLDIKSIFQTSAGNGFVGEIINSAGYVAITFFADELGDVVTIHKANIKLDATVKWQLKCKTYNASSYVQFNTVYTYNQQ